MLDPEVAATDLLIAEFRAEEERLEALRANRPEPRKCNPFPWLEGEGLIAGVNGGKWSDRTVESPVLISDIVRPEE